MLNSLQDTLEHERLDLLTQTVAARLVSEPGGRRVTAVEAQSADGRRTIVRGKRFVVAANGIESAGLLLRSELDTGDTGRNLFDHPNAALEVETRTEIGAGHGSSLATGASYRYYTGAFRRDRAAALLVVSNPGAIFEMGPQAVELLRRGRSGRALRREVAGTWSRTVKLEVYMDDVPQPSNRVELSSSKDWFGLPRNRVTYRRATPYLQRGLDHVIEDVPRQLAPLGVVRSRFAYAVQGAHMIGTLRMGADGDDGAVVDADGRHRLRENLFVAGSAVFPTFSPANPTATIAALSVRLGRSLARGPA